MKNKIIVSLFVLCVIIAASEGNVTNPHESSIWINVFGLVGCTLLFKPMLNVIAEINENV